MRWVWRAVIVVAILWTAVLAVILEVPGLRPAPAAGGIVLEPVADGAPTPAALGEFSPADPPRPAPDATFSDDAGKVMYLTDFRGRVVLVNLWATWCDPCVREMPSLDRLAGTLGGRSFAVLAISQDRGGAHVVDPFVTRLGLQSLKPYLDPKGAVGRAFGISGLPTSILIDRDGRELGRLEGAAQWDGADMKRLIQRYLAPAPDLQKASAD